MQGGAVGEAGKPFNNNTLQLDDQGNHTNQAKLEGLLQVADIQDLESSHTEFLHI